VLREVTILRSLVHANVVRLLDVVGNTERLYLIFEYDKTNHLYIQCSDSYLH
jgi:serine/threonine protein kinase